MRATFFFMAIFLSCLFGGCKEDKGDVIGDKELPVRYDAEFYLFDEEGRNIQEDISYNPEDKDEFHTDLREVYSDLYTVRCVEYPRQIVGLNIRLSDHPSFVLDNTLLLPLPFRNLPEVLTYTISSFRIFGDEAEHTMVTYWQEVDNVNECYRIDLDGETFGAGDDGIVEVVVRK